MAANSDQQRVRLSHFCWPSQARGLCRQDASVMYSRRYLCYQSQWIALSWMRINKIPGYWMQRLTWWRIQKHQTSRKYGYIRTPCSINVCTKGNYGEPIGQNSVI
ncbi:hypothetical protein AVEN_35273-1 [Araneus ventricosus]|uniref:Uncharacterized protein n=1 Tax=Araneus ventricosus TaxID=182803 RepID=A0A4Y2EH79_ARAVE|nr:hypothetical protein AVEN_35273-1 [Araneus ventricosus]